MVDSRFFENQGPLTLGKILALTGAHVAFPFSESASLLTPFSDVASLDEATSIHVSVLHNLKYLNAFKNSHAGLCFAPESLFSSSAGSDLKDPGFFLSSLEGEDPSMSPSISLKSEEVKEDSFQGDLEGSRIQKMNRVPNLNWAPHRIVLKSPHPYRDFALVAQAFYPTGDRRYDAAPDFIHKTAKIGPKALIETGAVIQAEAEIGEETRVGANAIVGKGVKIGRRCVIEQGVSLSHCLIGDDVIISANASIGQAGFGFFMDQKGHVSVPQLGRVLIGNKVEIGSGTTIDRGSLKDTIIGEGTRIDNLVMIAHNVRLGKGCVLVAQVGIAGSTELGDHVIVGAKSGMIGHLKIGHRVKIAAGSNLTRSVPDDAMVAGSPAVPYHEWLRQVGSLRRLGRHKNKRQDHVIP